MNAESPRPPVAPRGGNISRWSIEHPYIVLAFYLGVALRSVLVIMLERREVDGRPGAESALRLKRHPWCHSHPLA